MPFEYTNPFSGARAATEEEAAAHKKAEEERKAQERADYEASFGNAAPVAPAPLPEPAPVLPVVQPAAEAHA